MDSSGRQSSPSNSIPLKRGIKRKASEMIQTRRAQFFSKYQSQSFSLPDSIMFYMAQNPQSFEVYQKMIKSCKYFFVKNPVLVTSELFFRGNGKWKLSSSKRKIDLSNITSKLWITSGFFVLHENTCLEKGIAQDTASSVMPKLFQCDAKYVSIMDQIISFQDLSLLISSAVTIRLSNVTVKEENGSNVAVEKIVEVAVKARSIEIRSLANFLSINSETMEKIIDIPNFSKLDEFDLYGIPEAFDLETFCGYMKKNKTTKIWFSFDDSISEVYKNRLEEIIDEIIATETLGYKPPLINFAGQDWEKWEKLHRIFSSHY